MPPSPYNRDQLSFAAKKHSKLYIDSRQIYSRLRELLPQRLKQIVQNISDPELSAGQKRRIALLSDEFQELLKELTEVGETMRRSRVHWEHHSRMMDLTRIQNPS